MGMDDRDQAASAAAGGGELGHVPAFNLDALARATAGDESLQREVLEMLSGQIPPSLEAIRRAVRTRDADALHRASHTLLGSCTTLGACAMAELLTALERSAGEGAFDAAETLVSDLAGAAEATLAFLVDRGLLPQGESVG